MQVVRHQAYEATRPKYPTISGFIRVIVVLSLIGTARSNPQR